MSMKKIFMITMSILSIYSLVKGMDDASASLSADGSSSLSGESEFPIGPIDWGSQQTPIGGIGASLGMEEKVERRPIKVDPDFKKISEENLFPESILSGNYPKYRKFINLIADIYTNPDPEFHEEFLSSWKNMIKLSRREDESGG